MAEQEANISLSVIVPCYNVEKYLDKSLQCLERQWGERNDYEIILVNDGSKDGTINKLKEFVARHPDHTKLIDKQQNGGLAAARNSAMDIACGQWIAFFDPDDMLAEGSYDKLLDLTSKAEDYDMIRFGVQIVNNDENYPIPALSEPLTVDWKGTTLEYMLDNTYGTCWCYIYRREVLEGRRFPRNVIVEDLLFLVPLLLEGKKIMKTDAMVYYYYIRANAATSVAHDPDRLSLQSDDIASAIEILEGYKQGQPDEIQRRLFDKQQFLVHNMSTRILLSNKGTQDVNRIVQSMTKIGLFPMPEKETMTRLVNFVFTHLWALPLFRSMYRSFHSVYPKIRRLMRRVTK